MEGRQRPLSWASRRPLAIPLAGVPLAGVPLAGVAFAGVAFAGRVADSTQPYRTWIV